MDCTHTLELVHKTFQAHSAITVDRETCVIKMPMRLSDGNFISIFVREVTPNIFIVHDNANTLSSLLDLQMDVFDERSKQRWHMFNVICDEFNVSPDGWVLKRQSTENNLGDAVTDLANAIQGVYDLRFSSRKRPPQEITFKALVESKLKDEKLIFRQDKPKQGLNVSHKIDFEFVENGGPVIYSNAMSGSDPGRLALESSFVFTDLVLKGRDKSDKDRPRWMPILNVRDPWGNRHKHIVEGYADKVLWSDNLYDVKAIVQELQKSNAA